MPSSERGPILLHPFATDDGEQHHKMIVEQRDHLLGRIATREPRLVDLRRFQELFVYFNYAVEILEYSRVAGPDPTAELEFLAQAAEYISIYLAHATGTSDHGPTGDDQSIEIDVAGVSVVVAPTRFKDAEFRAFEAPFVIVTARDTGALESWRRFDIDQIFFPSRVGFTYRRHFLACFRSFVLDGVLDGAAIADMAAVAQSAEEVLPENKSDFSQFIYLFEPLTDALVALDAGHAEGFRSAMYEANVRHQAYWGSDQIIEPGAPKLRRDPRGWLSLPATAIAALGHDRGIELDFASDYMPTHLVTGTVDR